MLAKNSIIVDAGAREGNFALKYVNESKKIYIFECEKNGAGLYQKLFHHIDIKSVFIIHFRK